jgi:hypothetical protein
MLSSISLSAHKTTSLNQMNLVYTLVPYSLNPFFILFFYLCPGLQTGLIASGFQTKILDGFLVCTICVLHVPSSFIWEPLEYLTNGTNYEAPRDVTPHHPDISSLLGTDVLSIQFSDTLSQCRSRLTRTVLFGTTMKGTWRSQTEMYSLTTELNLIRLMDITIGHGKWYRRKRPWIN